MLVVLFLALAAQAVSGPRAIERTYWKAIELDGKPVVSQDSIREVYLLLKERGQVVSSDGCNQVAGSYKLEETSVRFGRMAATRMVCLNAGNRDLVFRDALKNARRLTVVGDRLELFASRNRRVAVFVAASTPPADSEPR